MSNIRFRWPDRDTVQQLDGVEQWSSNSSLSVRLAASRCSTGDIRSANPCGAELPESIAYNESERQALLKSEVERLDKEHEQHKIAVARAEAEATQQLANAALLLSVVAVANSGGS